LHLTADGTFSGGSINLTAPADVLYAKKRHFSGFNKKPGESTDRLFSPLSVPPRIEGFFIALMQS